LYVTGCTLEVPLTFFQKRHFSSLRILRRLASKAQTSNFFTFFSAFNFFLGDGRIVDLNHPDLGVPMSLFPGGTALPYFRDAGPTPRCDAFSRVPFESNGRCVASGISNLLGNRVTDFLDPDSSFAFIYPTFEALFRLVCAVPFDADNFGFYSEEEVGLAPRLWVIYPFVRYVGNRDVLLFPPPCAHTLKSSLMCFQTQ